MHWYFFLTTDGAMCSAHFSATSQTHLEELLNTYTVAGLDHLVLFITRSKFWAYFCQNGFAFVKRTLIGVSLWKSKQTAVGHTQISRKACIPLCYEMMRDLKRFFESLFVVVSLKCENDPKHYKLEHNGSSFCIEKATAAAKRNFSYTKGGRKTGLLARCYALFESDVYSGKSNRTIALSVSVQLKMADSMDRIVIFVVSVRIYLTVPECFRMFWTVPEFSKICQTIPE